MASDVADLTTDVMAYESCRAGNDTVADIITIDSQLSTLTTYLNSTNVVAWQDALTAANGLLDCSHVPVAYCSNSFTWFFNGNWQFCHVVNGNCVPFARRS